MIEAIQAAYESSRFDFRQYAAPHDPLQHLFVDWVDYYRMKWAIAHVLKPRRIVEFGVRFGYSARAFLDGSPGAQYVGIDLDVPAFGGSPGASAWLRENRRGHDITVLNVDSMTLTSLPLAACDLAHVDGQQDGVGTHRDLALALAESQWVLVDGVYWSHENFEATMKTLDAAQSLVEWFVVIPGYAGDVLIKVREGAAAKRVAEGLFYRRELPGWEVFRAGGGAIPWSESQRLALTLAGWTGARRCMDVGAGRGELATFLALNGCDVVAVESSSAACDLIAESVAAWGPHFTGSLVVEKSGVEWPVSAGSMDAVLLCGGAWWDRHDLLVTLARALSSLSPRGFLYAEWGEATLDDLTSLSTHAQVLGFALRQFRWPGIGQVVMVGEPTLIEALSVRLASGNAATTTVSLRHRRSLGPVGPGLRVGEVAVETDLVSVGLQPLFASYHLVSTKPSLAVYDGIRTPLMPLPLGARGEVTARVVIRGNEDADACLALVQEGVRWVEAPDVLG
jgi:predicted O-methyltransferase YrrM/precorrin-6B methylase 2